MDPSQIIKCPTCNTEIDVSGALSTKIETELKTKNEKIAQLNEDIKNYILGEGSYCYLSFATIDNGIATFFLVHEGKYPLYDVNVRIVDLAEFNKIPSGQKLVHSDSYEKRGNLGNINPGQGVIVGEYNLIDLKEKKLNIFFYARNGTFTQVMRLKNIKNKWVSATQVKKENQVLFTQIDSDYPRTNEGEIDWN